MEGTFTPFNTIIFDDGTEISNKKYFTDLEKDIRNDLVHGCNYDSESMTLTYIKEEIWYNLDYTVGTEKCTPEVIAQINRLVTLENNRRNAEKMKEEAEERQRKQKEDDEALIKEARKGNILSERARQLYLAKLNDELKYLGKLEWFKDSENNSSFTNIADALTWSGILSFWIAGGLGLVNATGATKLIALAFIAKAAINIYYVFNDKTSIISRFIASIITNTKKIFKFNSYKEKREIIKHKIEWLENYNITGEEKNKAYISRINAMIRELDEENKRKFADELTEETQKYYTSLINSTTNGLSIENEEYVRLNFYSYLTKLEYRIASVKNGKTYGETIEQKIAPVDHSFEPTGNAMTKKLEVAQQ